MGNFLTSHFMGSGSKISLFIAKINSQSFIYLMLYRLRYSFMINVQTLFEQRVSIGVHKQIPCILAKFPLLGHLYDEVIPTQWEFTNKQPLSYTYLFATYHKPMQGGKGKPTVWNNGFLSGFSVPTSTMFSKSLIRKIEPLAQEYCPLSSMKNLMGGMILRVAKLKQCTKTFLTAFLSDWLCTFILPVRDVGCIHLDTFNTASFIVSSTRYCLRTIILASIYKGLNEISCSSHPGKSGDHLSIHFLSHGWQKF
ncbi:hypothetical protein Cgig2_017907 [Carnegiea gigantea]|uniref:Uncharacterized protein n=1 Tax=Carnegiea gigantea TaxID=171969 RepID=A0A9Q1K662_9CARY|nr:hypothetical protein Cgig2_017907 [Carnegiea gigantea]